MNEDTRYGRVVTDYHHWLRFPVRRFVLALKSSRTACIRLDILSYGHKGYQWIRRTQADAPKCPLSVKKLNRPTILGLPKAPTAERSIWRLWHVTVRCRLGCCRWTRPAGQSQRPEDWTCCSCPGEEGCVGTADCWLLRRGPPDPWIHPSLCCDSRPEQ